MTDTTWRDVYDDPEGMACALDRLAASCRRNGALSASTMVDAAAACIRELAEKDTPAPAEGQLPAGWRQWQCDGCGLSCAVPEGELPAPAPSEGLREALEKIASSGCVVDCAGRGDGSRCAPCIAQDALSAHPQGEESRTEQRVLIRRVEVGEGAYLAIPDPAANEDGGVEWVARYGVVEGVRFQIASVLASFESLLTQPRLGDAIKRLRLVRNAYAQRIREGGEDE